MSAGPAIRNVIIGTAGHVDHGKSSLVRALTGVDPDRLAEEQARGMTIDLGFAPWPCADGSLVGLIDVPGHERFIRNMVAGATSVDIALLVVAADDGVMPQTREHLAILELLGVTRGVVALTKRDLVESELADLARADVSALLAGTGLSSAAILPVSSVTGDGLDALRAELERLAGSVAERERAGPFRLPVQRVFSRPGHGTVVTGVPVAGRAAPGDLLEVVGRDGTLRVRGCQAYGAAREEVLAGHSAALNLGGISHQELQRGDVVATPGVFRSRRNLAAHYRHVAARPLRNGAPVRVHVGTAEALGRVVLLEAEEVAPGEEAFIQCRLEQAVVAAPGDRFVLRHAAELVLLGGGVVLAGQSGRLKRFKPRVLTEVQARLEAQGDPGELARAVLASAGRRGFRLDELVGEVGASAEVLLQALAAAEAAGQVLAVGPRRFVDAGAAAGAADELVAALSAGHRAAPLREWLELGVLRNTVSFDADLLEVLLARDERVESAPGGRVRKRGWRVALSAAQVAARTRITETLRLAGLAPPTLTEELSGLPRAELDSLLKLLVAAGELVAAGGLHFHAQAVEQFEVALRAHAAARQGAIDIPALRDETATTRKFLIPLLERLDARGTTCRRGEGRILRNREADA